jgi:hypothetical protein
MSSGRPRSGAGVDQYEGKSQMGMMGMNLAMTFAGRVGERLR